MKIRLGIATYGRLEKMANSLSPEQIPNNVELVNMNLVLNELSSEAARMEREHNVDAFIASGGNAEVLSSIVTSLPVVQIIPTGFDIIRVLQKVSLKSQRVACIFYENSVTDVVKAITALKDIVNLEIVVKTYSTKKQLESIILELKDAGFRDVVGGSLSIQVAAEHGLFGHYILTESGLIAAIRRAAELVESKYKDAMQARQLASVLGYISEGIIATNQDDVITIFNSSAERIFNIRSKDAIGKRVDRVLSNTRLNIVRQTGREELNQIQTEGNLRILTNRVPIISDSVVIGALATFRDIKDVENAEAQIRHKLYSRGLMAKYNFSDLIGNSRAFRQTIQEAYEYSHSDATLLITGESGTGKELFAQSIHNSSSRSGNPFVAVNCAAVPPQLLESELFGYEEGAFTGAKRGGKRGVFELADTGTVFLDEVGEISPEIQALLLRVIEQKEVMRIGSERIRPIDIRIITATNKNLWTMVQAGQFRRDLYYRLNILSLNIPSLRQRKEDIPELLKFYLQKYCSNISAEEIDNVVFLPEFSEYDWPGNVRELRNIAERFSVLSQINHDYRQLMLNSLQGNEQISENPPSNGFPTRADESQITAALKSCSGNKAKAAELLGISRSTLWRRMKELGIHG